MTKARQALARRPGNPRVLATGVLACVGGLTGVGNNNLRAQAVCFLAAAFAFGIVVMSRSLIEPRRQNYGRRQWANFREKWMGGSSGQLPDSRRGSGHDTTEVQFVLASRRWDQEAQRVADHHRDDEGQSRSAIGSPPGKNGRSSCLLKMSGTPRLDPTNPAHTTGRGVARRVNMASTKIPTTGR